MLIVRYLFAVKFSDMQYKLPERIQEDGNTLEFADKSLQKDKEVVLAAVQQNGLALEYADKSLQKDKEVVLAAVKENEDGYANFDSALQYADKSLQKDKEVVLAAVQQNGDAFRFADKSLQKDKEIKEISEASTPLKDWPFPLS